MGLPNSRGTEVDPVPMLVAVCTAFLVGYAWGPLYLMALGISVGQSLVVVTVLFAIVAAVAYHRLIWTNYPERRREVPTEARFKRLVYGVLIGIGILILLGLPLEIGGPT